MIETILGILMIIILVDLVFIITVGVVWLGLWIFSCIKKLWEEIKEAQEQK